MPLRLQEPQEIFKLPSLPNSPPACLLDEASATESIKRPTAADVDDVLPSLGFTAQAARLHLQVTSDLFLTHNLAACLNT